MNKVVAVLLNYNTTRYTKACVKSLRQSQDADLEIVVWDNASDSIPKPDDFGNCDLVVSERNLGYAGGYNQAVNYAIKKYQPEYLLILNNDTRVPKTMIKNLVSVSRVHKDYCLVTPKIYFEHGHEFHKKSYSSSERGKVLWYAGGGLDWDNILAFHRGVDEVDRGQLNQESEIAFATGCCILLTPRIWRRLHGFDEKYFLYFEDVDLSERARRQGIKLLYTPEAHLYHINAGSTTGSGSLMHRYYQTRNRLRFGLKYGRLKTRLALLREAWGIWQHGGTGEKLGVLHAMEGRWGQQTIK